MSKFLEELQNKPLETRIKIFWISVIIVVVLIAVLWGTFAVGNKTSESPQDSQSSLVEKFKALFAENRNNYADNAEMEKQPVTILQVGETPDGKIVILFEVKNNSDYILTLLNSEQNTAPKIITSTGSASPISVATADGQPFPGKILSKTALAGSILIENPGSQVFTLEFSNLYYATPNIEKFDQSISTTIGYTVKANNPDELLPRQ